MGLARFATDLARAVVARLTRPERHPEGRTLPSTPRTMAGVWVDQETALRNAAVWACVRYLCNAIAQLPWRVMRETPDGGSERVRSHPADYVLGRRPNPEMGSFTFRETMQARAVLYGNAYAEIERDMAGRVVALWPLHPARVQVRRDAETGALIYRVRTESGGEAVDLAAADIFHIRGFGDDAVGYSVIEYAAQSIGWAQATELFGAAYFGQGTNPSGVIEGAAGLGTEAKRALEEEMQRLYGGLRNAHRTVILDAGMKWTRVSSQPEEAQMIETMQHQVEQVCRWFGVPPHKVMHLLRATFSNIEHQSIEVVVDSIVPWARRFEEEADFKLFGSNRQGLFTKMTLNALLRGDSAARGEFYGKLFQAGALSPNDILRLEDMNGIGADGDERFVPVNMQPLRLAARMQAQPAPARQAQAPAEDPQAPAGDAPESNMVVH